MCWKMATRYITFCFLVSGVSGILNSSIQNIHEIENDKKADGETEAEPSVPQSVSMTTSPTPHHLHHWKLCHAPYLFHYSRSKQGVCLCVFLHRIEVPWVDGVFVFWKIVLSAVCVCLCPHDFLQYLLVRGLSHIVPLQVTDTPPKMNCFLF